MSRDNLDSMRVDNVASGHLPGLNSLDITPASLSAIVPSYLGPQGPNDPYVTLRGTTPRVR
jgi:NADH dehydrogenase